MAEGSSAPQNGPGTRRHATPRLEPEVTPRMSLRAEQRACMSRPDWTLPACLNWLRHPDRNWL